MTTKRAINVPTPHKMTPLKRTKPHLTASARVKNRSIPATKKVSQIKGPPVGLLYKASRAQRLNKKYNS